MAIVDEIKKSISASGGSTAGIHTIADAVDALAVANGRPRKGSSNIAENLANLYGSNSSSSSESSSESTSESTSESESESESASESESTSEG